MSSGPNIALFLALGLMANAFCAPYPPYRWRRDFEGNQIDSKDSATTAATEPKEDLTAASSTTSTTEDDDDFDEEFNSPPSTGGGSNIFTLLNIANALFQPQSRTTRKIRDTSTIRDFLSRYNAKLTHRRQDTPDNDIEINYETNLKPPTAEPKPTFQRQESDESDSETSESQSDSEEDNVAKESVEKESSENANGDTSSKQVSASIENNNSDYDEPAGDGQGGGLLGLLGGLSGDGGSDIGALLATVAEIVTNLSGDGVDFNTVITTSISLFVGLLSDGEQNPGEIIAKYLQTSLDTITGGGAQNNGKFFGTFISKLIKGISAADDSGESEENVATMPMADSGGFLFSLLMGLLGDMFNSSFAGSSKPWR